MGNGIQGEAAGIFTAGSVTLESCSARLIKCLCVLFPHKNGDERKSFPNQINFLYSSESLKITKQISQFRSAFNVSSLPSAAVRRRGPSMTRGATGAACPLPSRSARCPAPPGAAAAAGKLQDGERRRGGTGDTARDRRPPPPARPAQLARGSRESGREGAGP